MALRRGSPFTFRAAGLCDAVDASNAPAGAMSTLANLCPSPATRGQFVPRPAATQSSNFAGFTTPAQVEALLVVGDIAWGVIASGRNAGKSEPFCYNLATASFVTIGNVTAANCPTTQAATGDWTPPTMAQVGNRIVITHPGYDGATTFVGWIDTRSFSLTTTGATHTSTTVDGLATTVGIQVGDKVSGAGIAANTYVTAIPTSTSVTLSQAATATASGVSLTFASGTPAAPLYGAGQTNGAPLTAVPVAVAQFNGRAWYAVANTLQYSDALLPLQITNFTQSITCGDASLINALGGLPLSNQVAGGTLQSLIAFKQDALYYQITGDQASSNLAVNAVPGSVGTMAPNSLAATPLGLAYIAPDGLRIIGLDGKSSDVIGAEGDGVVLPFLYAVAPSRIAAAYDQNVLRISVQNGYKNTQPVEEYWYHFDRKCWTGPHSFPAALIEAHHAGGDDFVLAPYGVNGKLFQSRVQPNATSTYTENGVALSFTWQPTLLPDNQQMTANKCSRAALGLTMPAGQVLTVTASDEQNAGLGTVTLVAGSLSGAAWGSFSWGAGTWGGTVLAYQEYALKWPAPLNFKQLNLQITGVSTAGLAIGNLYAIIQPVGYAGAH